MASQSLFGEYGPSPTKMPDKVPEGEPSSHPGKLRDFISERTSDLISVTTFSKSPEYVYISPSHKSVLGYDPSDLLRKSPFDLIHPDDQTRLLPLLWEYFTLLSQANPPSAEIKLPTERLLYRLRDKSGNWRTLETIGNLLSDNLILFISRDVTERVKEEDAPTRSRIALQTLVEERTRELTSANEELRESERKYRTILGSIEDGYYEVDLEGNLTFFNDALCRLTGYSKEELQGMNNRDYTEPETAKKMYEIFSKVYQTGEPSKLDRYEVIKKDGTKSVMELSTSLIRNSSGKGIGFRGFARDVTELDRIRRDLIKSEEKYRTIIETIDDGYFEVDLKGDMVFFNEGAMKILGYSREELMGMNNRKYQSEETARKVASVHKEVFRTGKPAKPFDWELIRKDGERRYVDSSASLIQDSEGRGIGIRGIGRDKTEAFLTRKALEESEYKYRNILSSVEEGYYEVDLKGNLVFFNDSMCRILGYSDQEMKGMNNRQFMTEETSKKVFQTFNQVYMTGEPTKVFGWELIRRDGEIRYVETSISLVRDSRGEPAGFRGMARDISESKRLEKAKERAMNHLSHELSTPLSIIEVAVERIPVELERGDKKKIVELAERVSRGANRLRQLNQKIEDILGQRPVQEKERILDLIETTIAILDELKDEPLDKGAEEIRRSLRERLDSIYKIDETRIEPIALDAFIEGVCQEARRSIKERRLEVVEKVERGILIEMDPKVLKKVCDGFLKNAIENTPDEGKVEIELRKEDDLAKLYFRDFGIGITPENQKLIFTGFFHTQDTQRYASKKPYFFNAGGSGADLLRAKIFSEKFGFTIDFSSKRCRHLPCDKDECRGSISLCPYIKGRDDCLSSGGSTFSLYLPLQRHPW